MKTSILAPIGRPSLCRIALLAGSFLIGGLAAGRADTAAVVTAANTLLTTSTAQTSPYALTTPVSTTYSLAYDKKWTNLPGTPPDSNRNGPVIGGGPVSFNTSSSAAYELSATVSSGQTVSPRTAALTLATTAMSATGYNTFNEIRNADDVIRSSPTTASSEPWQYGDYHVATLGTPSTSSPWMLQFTGHHFAANITYNGPYVSATPFFIGTEPPDYQSIGTDLTATEQAVLVGTNTVSSTTYTGDFLASYPYTTSPTTTYYRTAAGATGIGGGVAISGATSTSYTISATTASDNGFYYCIATNSSGSTTSNTVALTIAGTANANVISSTASTGTSPSPMITTQPASQTVVAGTAVTFTVAATNATSYQWYKIATTHRAPLETQRTVVSAIATAVQADTTLVTSAKLTGTFSDVVLGVTNSGDGNFPFIGTTPTYPTGTTGRGALISSMTTAQQAVIKPLVKAMIEAWVNTQASDISASLLADYESDAALAQTYVGYQVGAGAADSGTTRCNFDATINQEKTPINSQNSYLRVDGPRVWIEMVVQAAVAYKSNGFVHYHSLWRDRLADYGNEFGGFLDTTSTSTTYTRPSITTQPTSVSGSSATFTVVAAAGNYSGSTATLAYQWYSGTAGSGTAINGATSSTYTTSTAGSYYVVVSTLLGSVSSNTVTLSSTAATAPTITTQPATQTVVSGSTATFTVAATGSGTLSYQWYNASGAISGATSSTYTTGTAGSYYVIVTNTVGTTTATTTSSTATLYVNVAPTITTQPTSQSVNSGSSAIFTVAATGNGTLSYQWYTGTAGSGTAISGATAASYTTSTPGTYYVVVTNTLNSTTTTTTSSNATLTVSTAASPTITTQPVSQTVSAGGSVTFSVAATGSGTLTYQWYFGGAAISGATSASYTVSSVAASNAGSYYAIVTNTVGTSTASTTSSTATLMVNSAPTITTQPSSQTVVLGNSATFSVAATGSGTLSYQWYKGSVGSGTAISGATAASYTIATTTSASAGSYYVAVTNSVGTTNSTAATLTLQEPFAAFLATYGLTGTDPATDSDGDGISNLVEFVLGGNPTVPDTSILPTVSYTTSGGTVYLVYSFYTVANLGSVTWTVESSTDLSAWTTVVSGTSGVTITTTAYNASYNATVVTIPNTAGGSLFARLRATLPSTYTGTVSGTSTSTAKKTRVDATTTTTAIKTKNK